MQRAHHILLLVFLALMLPRSVHAQAQEMPPEAPSSLDSIPDIVNYWSYRVPQCDECTTDGTPFLAVPSVADAPPLPGPGDWIRNISISVPWGEISIPTLDPGNALRMLWEWGTWHIGRLFVWLVCMLFVGLQHVVNALAGAVNAVLLLLNTAWRLAIFGWLHLRAWLWAAWEFFNTLIAGIEQLQYWLAWLWAWAGALWAVLLSVLQLFGGLVLLIVDIILSILGLLSYLAGLTLSVMLSILAALRGDTLPTQLQDTHGVYYMLRGVLDAWHDSEIGWLSYLMYGAAYLAFFVWLSRYMSAAREG